MNWVKKNATVTSGGTFLSKNVQFQPAKNFLKKLVNHFTSNCKVTAKRKKKLSARQDPIEKVCKFKVDNSNYQEKVTE